MSSSAYRSSMNSQLEHLQSKYVGTGHADITKWEWAVNIHRDSLSAHLGNPGMLMYSSIALGDSMGRTKYNLLMVSSVAVLHLQQVFPFEKCFKFASHVTFAKHHSEYFA